MASTTKSATPKPGHGTLSKLFIKTPSQKTKFPTISTPSPSSSTHQQPQTDDNGRPRTSNKTKKARRLAQLINQSQPFSDELPNSLSSHSSALSKTSFLQTLRLIKTPSKAFQFFNWVRSTGFPVDNQAYFLMLERLGRARWLNAARNLLFSIPKHCKGSLTIDDDRLFNSLIRSYGQAGLFNESLKVFAAMKSMGVSPSVVTFNSLIFVVLSRGRTGVARQLFDEMLKTYGVTPDVFTFNILIRGFCMNSMVDDGFRFFNEMRRCRCEPDLVTYNTLVDGLCRAGKVEIAGNLVKGMYRKSLGFGPNVVTYTTLINGYCAKRDIAKALDALEEMINQGLEPNKITCNILIQGLCEARRFDKIKELFDGAIGHGELAPDTCTFNTLMTAHCNAGKLEEAISLFKKLSDFQVEPDSASYSILIRGLCEKGDFEKAEELFDELAEKEIVLCDKGSVPLSASYNPMFEHLCASGKTKKAEKVFRQLMKRGTQDPPSFRTLIMGHCREGTFIAGHRLLVLMLRRDFVPDYGTFRSLVDGLLLKGDPLLACRTLGMMLRSSHTPETSIFHSVLAELTRMGHACESAALLMEMMERKIRQNINLSTQTLVLLFKNGMRNKARRILSLLYDSGYFVRMEDLIHYHIDSKKLFDAHEALLFCLEMHGKADIHICDAVITGLCDARMISEAFHLYYELVEKGVKQLNSVGRLEFCLLSEGKLKEAEFVSKRMANRGVFGPNCSVNMKQHSVEASVASDFPL
ncbi:hypothetical protein Dimus_011003 [Dionaea muscipula]